MFVMNHMEANILNEESPNLERNFLIKRYPSMGWGAAIIVLFV